MIPPDELHHQILHRREKNLLFLERHYPTLHTLVKEVQLNNIKLEATPQPDADNLTAYNLIESDQRLYPESAQAYAHTEYHDFKASIETQPIQSWMRPNIKGCFVKIPRGFHQTREKIYQHSSLQHKGEWQGTYVPSPIPMVIFLGVGLGFHIAQAVEEHLFSKAILFEPNIEHFAASLYTTDWSSLFDQADKKGVSIEWVISDEPLNVLINTLSKRAITHFPIYPFSAPFFPHRGEKLWHQSIEDIKLSYFLHQSKIGNLDDELNQICQCIFNVCNFPIYLIQKKSTLNPLPAAIVAGGPSLDRRLNQLKSIENSTIIISVASTLVALYRYGIKPDIHIALESDKVGTDVINAIGNKRYLKEIIFYAPAQINPSYARAFKHHYAYFRKEGGFRSWLSKPQGLEVDGIPNALNLAVLVAQLLGFKNCYLFGTDLGFSNPHHHHAKNSLHYDETAHEVIRSAVNFEKLPLINQKAVDGRTIQTGTYYFRAKRALETFLKKLPAHRNVYNCSDGVALDGTQWISETAFDSHIKAQNEAHDKETMSHLHAFNAVDSADSKALKETVLHHITQSCPRLDVDRTELQAQANRLVSDLEMITQWMHAQLSDPIPSDLNAFTDTARSLINALDKNEQGFNAMAVRLVRNSVWLLIYDAFSHLFSMQPEQRPDFQKSWAHEVKAFFVHLPAHAQRMFNDVLSETATEATLRSITQTEWETPSSPLQ